VAAAIPPWQTSMRLAAPAVSVLLFALGALTGLAAPAAAQPTSDLALLSGNAELDAAFAWARDRVLDELVVTHLDDDYIPAYWGAYLEREAFYSRDICHQAEAGHLLGLDLENWSMLRQFALDAVPGNGYWPKWSYDFFGVPYFVDAGFKELPAPFEIVQRIHDQYLWTGDPAWVQDAVLFGYATNTLTSFLALQDTDANGIADETHDLATYWEQEADDFMEAGDAFGSQYQATLAYAGMLAARGDATGAAQWTAQAAALRAHFDTVWWSPFDERFIRGFREDGTWEADFGHENSFFMPMKELGDDGPRTQDYLDFVHHAIATKGINIEAKTYLPDAFFRHGRNELGWHWHLNVLRSYNTYPEVAFLVIGNTVNGLMGVVPDAPNHGLASLSRLVAEVPFAEVQHIPLGDHDLTLRHDGTTKSTLTHGAGDAPLTWEARFAGTSTQLLVDGSPVTGTPGTLNGIPYVATTVVVPVGQSAVVERVPDPSPPSVLLSALGWSAASNPANSKMDAAGNGYVLTIEDQTFAHGLGVAANGSLTFALGGAYSLFTAEVGVDDQSGESTTMTFEVWTDGTRVHDTGVVSGADGVLTVTADVTGVVQLRLLATDAGDGGGGWADWADARVHAAPGPYLHLAALGVTADPNGDGLLGAGETADVSVRAGNLGNASSGAASLGCQAVGPYASYVTVHTAPVALGLLAAGVEQDVAFSVTIDPTTPRGTPLKLAFSLGDGGEPVSFVDVHVTPEPVLGVTFDLLVDDGDGLPEPGETVQLALTASNDGTGPSLAATSTLSLQGPGAAWITPTDPVVALGSLAPATATAYTHELVLSPGTPEGTTFALMVTLGDGLDAVALPLSLTTPSPDLGVTYVSLARQGNDLPVVSAGKASVLTVEARNGGDGDAFAAALSATPVGPFASELTVLEGPAFLGLLAPGQATERSFTVLAAAGIPEGAPLQVRLDLVGTNDATSRVETFLADVISLSDLPPTYQQNGWGLMHRDASNQGLPITLEGVVHAKGFGTHANSELRFDLGGIYTRFTSAAGLDDEVGPSGSVVFEVWLDGERAWESDLKEGDTPTAFVDLDVRGVQELRLVADEGTLGISSDHADWASPRLAIEKGAVVSRVLIKKPELALAHTGLVDLGNGDGVLDPGESARLLVEVSSTGKVKTKPVLLSAKAVGATAAFVTVDTPNLGLGILNAGASVPATLDFTLDPTTPSGQLVLLELTASDGLATETLVVGLPVQAATLALAFDGITNDDDGDGTLEAGEAADLALTLSNPSPYPSGPVTSTCTAVGPNAGFVTVTTPVLAAGRLGSGGSTPLAHGLSVSSSIPDGTVIDLRVEVGDGLASAVLVQGVTVANPNPPAPTYLSDLPEAFATQDWGSLKKDTSVDGNPIRVGGTTYAKGLGSHAEGEVRYDLSGGWSRLLATAGVDDEVGSNGSVAFEVWLDGLRVLASPVVTGSSAGLAIDVDVSGASQLRLVILDGGNGINSDHADWADARLLP
jgi:hypothetical protein